MNYDYIGDKPDRDQREMTKALVGKIHVTVFFVSEISNRWKAEATAVEKQSLEEGERWLVGQAAKFGKTVSFVNSYFGDENDKPILVKNFKVSYSNHRSEELMKIHKKRNLDDWETYKRFVTEEMGCEHGAVVFIDINPDRSYATWSSSYYRFSAAVCHRNDRPGTYAHEILHLFGAWDMYKRDFDRGKAREEKCRWYFHDSIMHQSYYMRRQEIDEINAWLIGLKEEEKPWYCLFHPSWEYRDELISQLYLYYDWRTGEYSDKPVPPKPKPEPPKRVIPKKKANPLNSWKEFKDWAYDLKYLPKWKKHVMNFFGMTLAGMILIALITIWGASYNWKIALAFSSFISLNLTISQLADDI